MAEEIAACLKQGLTVERGRVACQDLGNSCVAAGELQVLSVVQIHPWAVSAISAAIAQDTYAPQCSLQGRHKQNNAHPSSDLSVAGTLQRGHP
jgi:hypothetical protein